MTEADYRKIGNTMNTIRLRQYQWIYNIQIGKKGHAAGALLAYIIGFSAEKEPNQ